MARDAQVVDDVAQRRLRWACRRGLLELDLLLSAFLDRGFRALDARGRTAFERLLAQPDEVLSRWLLAGVPTGDPQLDALVRRIA